MECKAKRNNTPWKKKKTEKRLPRPSGPRPKRSTKKKQFLHVEGTASPLHVFALVIERQSMTTHHKKQKELAMTAPSSTKA